ncbi:hypothetical protein RHMOL_Rhmol07G0064800 [Rhododendron molle]|uniref:Uncharacterized protein n=1 Tax=Rhododendron molle TaxID=49168 RepID=A0ACC0MYX3_RHOML|nr:hypothetical protein RHMOL_Rhmol07G0064800 [Rhododendron molle]
MMEPSFPVISVGVLNQLLLFIGKSGKIETVMMIFLKIVATGGEISVSTYLIVLKNLLAAGNWRKYIEVLGWMEDAGIQPSFEMYRRILHKMVVGPNMLLSYKKESVNYPFVNFELCYVLKCYGLVDVQQEEPYGDITLKLTPKIFKDLD